MDHKWPVVPCTSVQPTRLETTCMPQSLTSSNVCRVASLAGPLPDSMSAKRHGDCLPSSGFAELFLSHSRSGQSSRGGTTHDMVLQNAPCQWLHFLIYLISSCFFYPMRAYEKPYIVDDVARSQVVGCAWLVHPVVSLTRRFWENIVRPWLRCLQASSEA